MNEQYDDMEIEYEFYVEEEEVKHYAIRPNKSQIKRDLAALFELAEKMSGLTFAQLESLELPENIFKAVTQASGMPPKSARKRLLKYIAGQLHKIETEPMFEKLARIENKSAHAVREHHLVERWRDRLLSEGNDALTELLDEYPGADRQHLRQLLRNAQKESESSKPPRSSRVLYRYLKSLIYNDSDENILDDLDDEINEDSDID